MKKESKCASPHTPCPEDYLSWHEWAEQKTKTHRQIKCPECGRLSIWVLKATRNGIR